MRFHLRVYPVSFLSKCHCKEPQRSACSSNILPQRSSCVSRTQAQATRNQPQEDLILSDAKRSSCACIIFGRAALYKTVLKQYSLTLTVWHSKLNSKDCIHASQIRKRLGFIHKTRIKPLPLKSEERLANNCGMLRRSSTV